MTEESEAYKRRAKDIPLHIQEQVRNDIEAMQEDCDHEEEMKQGDGRVYGVCKKCQKELY